MRKRHYKLNFKIQLETDDKEAYHILKDQQEQIETFIFNEVIKMMEKKEVNYII